MIGRLVSIEIMNIGIIKNIKETINKPLILFFGQPMQGKTTILDCFIYACGGGYPNDIIRHGEKSAFIEIMFEFGMVRRKFYIGKDDTVRERPVTAILNGRPISVKELRSLLNPFLLDQNFFIDKNIREKNKYFLELFNLDLTEEDKKLKEVQEKASKLRAKIDQFGDIDCSGVKPPVPSESLEKEKEILSTEYRSEIKKINEKNEAIRKSNDKINEDEKLFKKLMVENSEDKDKILELQKAIASRDEKIKEIKESLKNNKEKAYLCIPDPPDTKEIDERINNNNIQKVLYKQYLENVKRNEEKEFKKKELKDLERQSRDIKKEKLKKLAEIDTTSIKGLSLNEDAIPRFEGFTMDMLSHSQEMRLSSLLAGLYSKSMPIELIDKAESLGISVYEYIEKAKKEEKTILATIVGERHAIVPKDVGVYVVNNGEIKGA